MRRERLMQNVKTGLIVVGVYLVALYCGGCQSAGGGTGGTATTRPAISAQETRLAAMTEAWKGYAAAERAVSDLHRTGAISDAVSLDAYRGLQQARGYLEIADSLIATGTEAEFRAALKAAEQLVLKVKGSKGPVGGVIQEEVERFADQRA